MSESGLAETLQPHLDELDRTGAATIAFQASGIEGLKVRITVKAADNAAAEAVLAREEAQVRKALGGIVFATDDDTMESVILAELARRGQTLAIAESLTGGLMAHRMTGVEPAMTTFKGAIVGPVASAGDDRSRALQSAGSARGHLGADIGIAAVLPATTDEHAPGTVFLGIDLAGTEHATTVALPGDRNRLGSYAVISLLEFLRKTLG